MELSLDNNASGHRWYQHIFFSTLLILKLKKLKEVHFQDMARYKGSDVTSPCFNYDSVVSARLPIFNSTQFASQLLFCHSMPFTIEIPIVTAVGPGCDSVNPCWVSSQFASGAEAEGPGLTELVSDPVTKGKLIVSLKSPSRAVYAFEKYVTAAADGYPVPVGTPIILIRVTQPGGDTGYLHMHTHAASEVGASSLDGFFPTETISKIDAVAAKIMWGVIGRPAPSTNCMLMYFDANLTSGALPMLQMFNWGNVLYFSRGKTTSDTSGTHTAFHGVTTNAYPSIPVKKIVYFARTMTLLSNFLPEFEPTDLETGAANIQWALHALPMSELAASVYADAYCSTVCNGMIPSLSSSGKCPWIQSTYPEITLTRTCSKPATEDLKDQKTLAMVSFGIGVVEFILLAVVLGLVFSRRT